MSTDRCGYPAGQEHPHVEQCHRAEREQVLARIEALAEVLQPDGEVGTPEDVGFYDGVQHARRALRALIASVREGAER